MPHDHDDIFEADNATRPGRGPVDHPTMLSSCARAATAAELRYRVQAPNSRPRTSRIFALDPAAAEAMYAITEDPWTAAHFLTVAPHAGHLRLSHPDGRAADLDGELDGADLVVLLASDGSGRDAAATIARACAARHLTCAGLALTGDGDDTDQVVNAMRPFARVLVVARDREYIPAMLTAMRA